MSHHSAEGILNFQEQLMELMGAVENTDAILTGGSEAFVKDLLKLPKPRSEIKGSKHTHLVDSFSYKRNDDGSYTIGWGKYYGRMVERGTKYMKAQPHFKPLWNRNKEKYYKKMLEILKLD